MHPSIAKFNSQSGSMEQVRASLAREGRGCQQGRWASPGSARSCAARCSGRSKRIIPGNGLSARVRKEMERPVKNSEVISKNIFPFPTCMLGGEGADGDCRQDLQAFQCRWLFLRSRSVRILHGFCRQPSRTTWGFGDVFSVDAAVCGGTVVPVSVLLISVGSWLWGAPQKGKPPESPQEKGAGSRLQRPCLPDEPRASGNGLGACPHPGTGSAFSIPPCFPISLYLASRC